ncbi:MAG: acyltransferase [Candidatus Gastranaerophilales bacterium]|nr:acyltransferase [Candidatus Gastranaerophilales bacterium]
MQEIIKIQNKFRGFLNFPQVSNLSLERNCQFMHKSSCKLEGNNHIGSGSVVNASRNKNSIIIGKNSKIHRYSILQSAGGFIHIGKNTNIGDFCWLSGQGGLKIGDNVLFASYVKIIPNQHSFDDISMPISDQTCKAKGIVIKNNSWIGMGVTILDGVTIGKNCVLAAGTVVTKNVPDYTVVAGIPAKPIKIYDKTAQSWVKTNL